MTNKLQGHPRHLGWYKAQLLVMLLLGLLMLSGTGWSSASVRAEDMPGLDWPWIFARQSLPPAVPVLRPAWVPAHFGNALTFQQVQNKGAAVQMGYAISYSAQWQAAGRVVTATLTFALNLPSAQISYGSHGFIQHLRVRGVDGTILQQGNPFVLAVTWRAGPRTYVVLAAGVSKPDLLRVVASLQPYQRPLGRGICPGSSPQTVVRAYYAAAARADALDAQACLTATYRQWLESANVVEPDWQNIATIHLIHIDVFTVARNVLPVDVLATHPVRWVQVVVSYVVQWRQITTDNNGPGLRFIYLVQEHAKSSWRIAGIGSGP